MARESELPVDSKEGITILLDVANANGLVLNEWHEETAKRHGVPIPEGVIFSCMLPMAPDLVVIDDSFQREHERLNKIISTIAHELKASAPKRRHHPVPSTPRSPRRHQS